MEICYIEAGVLERMLARAENLSAHVDRLYERNRRKEPRRVTGRPRMSACALTSRRVPCRPSAIPDGWRSPASSASSITSPKTWRG